MMMTELDDVPPALVAVQVSVTPPAVSEVTLAASQPDDEDMVDSGSVTFQLTFTLLVYHPLVPKVPLIFAAMIGGVESEDMTLIPIDAVSRLPSLSLAVRVMR